MWAKSFFWEIPPIDRANEWIFSHSSTFVCLVDLGEKAPNSISLESLIFCKIVIFFDSLVDIFKFTIYRFRRHSDAQRQAKFNAHAPACKINLYLYEILLVSTSRHNTLVKHKIQVLVITLATRITVIFTKKTDKITYVLLVKIVTDEPINSLNFYRWLWEQTFFLLKFFFSKSLFL